MHGERGTQYEEVQRNSQGRNQNRFHHQEYRTKADFIHDLRCNGYKVNPMKVKTSRTFDYIINHTDCNPWDWKLTDKEVDDITDYHPGRSM